MPVTYERAANTDAQLSECMSRLRTKIASQMGMCDCAKCHIVPLDAVNDPDHPKVWFRKNDPSIPDPVHSKSYNKLVDDITTLAQGASGNADGDFTVGICVEPLVPCPPLRTTVCVECRITIDHVVPKAKEHPAGGLGDYGFQLCAEVTLWISIWWLITRTLIPFGLSLPPGSAFPGGIPGMGGSRGRKGGVRGRIHLPGAIGLHGVSADSGTDAALWWLYNSRCYQPLFGKPVTADRDDAGFVRSGIGRFAPATLIVSGKSDVRTVDVSAGIRPQSGYPTPETPCCSHCGDACA